MTLRQYFDGFFDVMGKIDTVGEIEAAERWVGEFYLYMDSLAASNPHRFHHVYEWYQVGNQMARLFELNVKPSGMGTVISYDFKESVTPNSNGQFFPNKASVMESGQMVTFTTERAVPIDDEFRTGRFTFKPGGDQTTGAFGEAFITFFGGKVLVKSSPLKTITPTSYSKQGGIADGVRLYDSIVGE